MPSRHHFHEPLIEGAQPQHDEPPEASPEPGGPIEAIAVQAAGVYLRVEAVAAELRRMGLELGHRSELSAREALESAADAFSQVILPGSPPGAPEGGSGPQDAPQAPPGLDAVLDLPVDDDRVARVEVFADAAGKWYSRSIDAAGLILEYAHESFDHSFVVRAAAQRWPGVEVHEIADAQVDSTWEEQHHAFGWNGRRRPSPARLWPPAGTPPAPSPPVRGV